MNTCIHNLEWHSLLLDLSPRRKMGHQTPLLIILNAFFKSVEPKPMPKQQVKLAFHLLGRTGMHVVCKPRQPLLVEVLFFAADEAWLQAWLVALRAHIKLESAGFDLLTEPIPQCCRLPACDMTVDVQQVELDFCTPFPNKPEKGATRTSLNVEQLFSKIRQRIKALFGIEPEPVALAGVQLLANYWHYAEFRQHSKSQVGHMRYHHGCVGRLYLSGALGPLLPWLLLAERIHAGGELQLNFSAYFKLHLPARPNLSHQLQKTSHWRKKLVEMMDEHDDLEEQLEISYGFPFEPDVFCRDMSSKVLQAHWQPVAAQSYLKYSGQKKRHIERLAPAELLLNGVLHALLREPVDRLLEVSAVGYRRGNSVQKAAKKVRGFLDDGFHYIVESDIESFFPSIDIDRVLSILKMVLPPADTLVVALFEKLLFAPFMEDGKLQQRQQGLALGSPLSPLLANLYLDDFDEAFNDHDVRLVRYADDFVILCRSQNKAEEMLALARHELEESGLSVNEQKTAIRSVKDGFRFLGQSFGGEAEDKLAELLVVPQRKTLYITLPGCFLGRNGDAVQIRRHKALLDVVPLRRVLDIIVLVPASFSSALFQKCAELGIPITMTLGDGYHVASLLPDSRRHHDIAAMQALHYFALSSTEKLVLAKGFATAKINNYKPLIQARYEKGSAKLLQELDRRVAGIEQAATVAAIRGYEGLAAKACYRALNRFIKVDEFHFKTRKRKKADKMNSLFNFAYYLLFSRLNTMMRAEGLNPYLGFLHDGQDNYETLVCDIEELFRAAVDRHLIALVNRREIRANDFEQTYRGLRLKSDAIKRFLTAYENFLLADVEGQSLLQAMETQVRVFRGYVSQDAALHYFDYQTFKTGAKRS